MKSWQQKIEVLSRYSALVWGFSIPLSTTGMSIFSVLTVVLVILSGNLREKFLLARCNPLALATFGLFTLFFIGCFYSIAPLHDRLYELNKYRELLFLPFILPIFLEERWRRLGLLVFMVAMSIQLVGGTFMNLFVSPLVTTLSHDHISIGLLMAFVCFVYFHLAIQQHGKKCYLSMALFIVTAIYLLFFNTGRTAYVLFFGLMITSSFQILRWRGLLIGMLCSVLLAVTAYYLSPTFQKEVLLAENNSAHYLNEQQNAEDVSDGHKVKEVTSEGLRLQWLHDSLLILKTYPVAGVGTGAYLAITQKLFPNYDQQYFTDKPHHDILTITTQLGAIGLFALLALYACHAYVSLSIPKPYNVFAQLLLVTMLVGGLFNSLLRDGVEANFYAYMAALCLAQYKSKYSTLL